MCVALCPRYRVPTGGLAAAFSCNTNSGPRGTMVLSSFSFAGSMLYAIVVGMSTRHRSLWPQPVHQGLTWLFGQLPLSPVQCVGCSLSSSLPPPPPPAVHFHYSSCSATSCLLELHCWCCKSDFLLVLERNHSALKHMTTGGVMVALSPIATNAAGS